MSDDGGGEDFVAVLEDVNITPKEFLIYGIAAIFAIGVAAHFFPSEKPVEPVKTPNAVTKIVKIQKPATLRHTTDGPELHLDQAMR